MPTRKACNRTEPQILQVRLFKFNLLYQWHKPGLTGTRLCLGSRHWLKPGTYLWEVSIRRYHEQMSNEVFCRVWRSGWRRPVPALNKPPVFGAWERVPRRKEEVDAYNSFREFE